MSLFILAIRNLVAVYPMDASSGARDLSPTRNLPGKLSRVSIAPGPDGQPDTSLQFLGKPNSYIDFPNFGRLDTRRSTTVLAWAYNEGTKGPILQYVGPLGAGVGLSVVNKNQLKASIVSRTGSKKISVISPTNLLRPRTWTYVGFTYEYATGTAAVYVNSKPVVRKIIGQVELRTNRPARAGATKNGGKCFTGRLSCIQVYSRALNVKEIALVKKRCFKRGE